METIAIDIKEVLSSNEEAVAEINRLMLDVQDDKVNTVPYEGSWTAPQLLRHVTKSISGLDKALQMNAKPADRNPAERIGELKEIFLNFEKKLKQPDFLIPEEKVYDKQIAVDELRKSFEHFKQTAAKVDTNELLEGLPFGPVTKLELIHFVLFHTQRHLHQMKKITGALKNE